MGKKAFIPTRDLIIFPGIITPLFIGRETSISTLEKAMIDDNRMVLCMQKDFNEEEPKLPEDVYKVGVIVNILQTVKMPNGTIKVLVEAKNRISLTNVIEEEGAYYSEFEDVEIEKLTESLDEALRRKVMDTFEKYAKLSTKILPDLIANLRGIDDLGKVFDIMSSNLPIPNETKQEILEVFDLEQRAYKLIDILTKEIDIANIEKTIDSKVKDKLNAAQKSYYLKEKINAMKEELGDSAPADDDLEELTNSVKSKKLPKEVKKKLEKELKRLYKMGPFSAEATVVRSYIETVLEIPWTKMTKDLLDIEKAAKKLDADHYGLKDVKERILEFLAVKKLNPDMRGSILCLVGPPGVGKTSLARSIADSMGRSFVRISLGGVRDEAEIRGHRRTYIGSMPGRIIKGIKQAKTKNPVILLDELDKMASDFKGDPASAMLEVLDPEQNMHFEDHYLDMPFDLSKVFFVATANDLSGVPGPLRDRMELIRINSYTEFEKLHIAKRYLLDQAQIENGLKNCEVKISDEALMRMINEYTREPGVRNLKREVSKLYRRIAREVVKNNKCSMRINVKNLEKYMGKPKFRPDKQREKNPKLGIVTGLAWTAVGGTALEVQAVSMEGKGKLSLTGKLGEVMKESAQVAYSYVRSQKDTYSIEDKFNEKYDIHLHFPEGAVPKDGPSAGITITTALISVLAGKNVRQDIAMTGEVTITGEVLPVGGIKEKVIGAHRVGIREVILPADNETDVDELPAEISKDMKFHFVNNYEEVGKLVFAK